VNNNLVPVSPDAPQAWKAGPGLKGTLVSSFQADMGVPNLLPLFAPVSPAPNYVAASGSGSNATYAIVGFVGITITQASGSGSGMTFSVQPMAVVGPTAVILNPTPARPSQVTSFGTTATTFVSAKLTQ
jgi:hypothetical protein